MPYVTTQDDVKIYYESVGSGRPILFIHPSGMGHVTFKYQRTLSDHYQIITVDLRGNGRSGRGEITIKQMATDMIDVLNNLQIEKAVICGYSNGGSIALEFALSYPERASGLILCGGFSEVNDLNLYVLFYLGIASAKLGVVGFLAKEISLTHSFNKAFEQELNRYYHRTDREMLLQMYSEGLKYRCTDRLHLINVPLLLVYGTRDKPFHHYMNLFRQAIPDTEVAFILDARHEIPTRNHNEFNIIIKQFMEKLAAQSESVPVLEKF